MDREVLVWVTRITWFLEDYLYWFLGFTLALLLIGVALFIDWLIERKKG